MLYSCKRNKKKIKSAGKMQSKIVLSKKPLKDIDFAIIDIETTGLSTTNDRSIEIAAVKTRNGKVIDKFHSLIYINYIPYAATMVHGIDENMVKDAPRLNVVRGQFNKFIKGCILVGHNIKRFDLKFLCKDFKLSNNACCIDTLHISRNLFPGEKRHNLQTVAERLGVRNTGCHRALSDATTTCMIFTKFLSLGKDRFNSLKDILVD